MKAHTLTIYKDKQNEFRFHVQARNGTVIDASSQGFTRYPNCRLNYSSTGEIEAPLHWRNRARKCVIVKGKEPVWS